jgi:hypothetical protein
MLITQFSKIRPNDSFRGVRSHIPGNINKHVRVYFLNEWKREMCKLSKNKFLSNMFYGTPNKLLSQT